MLLDVVGAIRCQLLFECHWIFERFWPSNDVLLASLWVACHGIRGEQRNNILRKPHVAMWRCSSIYREHTFCILLFGIERTGSTYLSCSCHQYGMLVMDVCMGCHSNPYTIYYILVWDRPTEVTPEAQFEMSTRSGTLKDPASYEASAARDETTWIVGSVNLSVYGQAMFFLPEVVDAKLPLLLYLHGAGEMRGELHEIISEAASDLRSS